MIKVLAGAALLTCASGATAQERYPQGPVINPDHTVTFKIKAPAAQEVKLEGAWPGGTARTSIEMTKGADGTWTATSGPIAPDLWTYSFRVDGVRLPDPSNLHTFQENNISALLVPGTPGTKAWDYELHDVPHGTVSAIWYPATSLKLPAKRTQVYTPPGYEGGSQRYPVLYLGANDHADWINLTRANNILDNLIAQGKTKPLIVVFVGTIPDAAAPPWLIDTPLPSTVGRPSRFSATLNPHGGMLTLPPYFDGGMSIAKDLVPFIDKTYRTIPDRDHRAVVGISAPGVKRPMSPNQRPPDQVGKEAGGRDGEAHDLLAHAQALGQRPQCAIDADILLDPIDGPGPATNNPPVFGLAIRAFGISPR